MSTEASDDLLMARDGSEYEEVLVLVPRSEIRGPAHWLAARGRPLTHLTICAEHFIARGVCVDCTRAAGRITYAS
jgi:hypothetical protein